MPFTPPLEDEAFREAERREAIEEEAVPSGVRLRESEIVGKAGGRALTGDLCDRDAPPSAPRPAVVFLHGGAWRAGTPRQFRRQASRLALRYGVLSLSVGYRLSGEARFPAALNDAKCAIRFLRANAPRLRVDPSRIAVCGGSAGAHLAAMIAATEGVAAHEGDGGWPGESSRADLAILLNGTFDLRDLARRGGLPSAMKEFLGAAPEQNPAIYAAASPLPLAHPRMPPCLFLHGDRDRVVSFEQSVAMHERLRALGVPSEIEIYPGKPHAWFNEAGEWLAVQERIERFIENRFGIAPAE